MSTQLFVFFAVVLALPMVAAIESGFLFWQSHETRRILYAAAAVWYATFLVLFAHRWPWWGWFYVIPQMLVAFVYAATKFRAAPSRRR